MTPAVPPADLPALEVRAVRVPPAVVLTVIPHDLNIVLQRLEPVAPAERFDLVIATNLLVYYDVFERSLALANVAQMLRPGGLFLANNSTPVILPPPLETVGYSESVFSSQINDRDRIVWYRRR
jgi:chemotaxis methyl-accepting protein methylase